MKKIKIPTDNEIITDLIRRAEKAGISMADLCTKADTAKVTPWRWRNSKRSIVAEEYRKLESALSSIEAGAR
jgi:hypothetical protein